MLGALELLRKQAAEGRPFCCSLVLVMPGAVVAVLMDSENPLSPRHEDAAAPPPRCLLQSEEGVRQTWMQEGGVQRGRLCVWRGGGGRQSSRGR